jgi:uncharacterized membrane protein
MRYGLSLAALAAAFLVGCNKTPEGGDTATGNTFTISGPDTSTTIKQGDTESVKITLNRNKGFNQNVKLAAKPASDKIKAEFKDSAIATTDPAEQSLAITVDKDAPEGDHTVNVTGTPDSGKAVSLDVKVKVAKNP